MYDKTGSIRATARNLGLNRKTITKYVNEYLEAKSSSESDFVAYLKSEPRYKDGSKRQKKVLTGSVCSMIDGFLKDNDEKRARGDRKLCMKATDIHSRLKSAGYDISYPSVTKYIQNKEKAHTNECYIRQVYSPGIDCEFDWGELHLCMGGQRMKLYIAVFTLAYSNYRMAFLFFRQDTLAFLESHQKCFDIFSAVPHRMVYDNMRVAVGSFVGGKQPTEALLRLERAYGFKHRFCNVRSGNEKGHVERSVEYVRRKAFNSRNSFKTLEEANMYLYDVCMDLNMTSSSPSTADIIYKSEEDMRAMLPLKDRVCCFESRQLRVDKYGTVMVSGDKYSVPDNLVGEKVDVHDFSNLIEIYYQHKKVAEHEKTPVNGWKLDLMHYLKTFEAKPGSIAGSAALHYAEPELREVFDDHFSDNPAEFISILKEIKNAGMTLEDLICAHDMLEANGVNPGMKNAIRTMLFPTVTIKADAEKESADSAEIERYAMDGLHRLTEIMNFTN